jgi:signal transduction histidine kinase
MLAGIAHEVRNPLGAMELFAGALAQDVAGRPEASHVARIRGELDGLRQLVEDFLDYARARPLAVEELDAALLAAEVGELALPLARARGVELVQEGGGLLSADRHALRRAALNLTRNAIEASPPGGRVELSARVERGRLLLEVRDRGPGLSAQAREHLFEPFHTTKEGGTGLGLALARKVALAHGGTLELLEREGGGVVARLALPDAPRAPGLQPEGESAYNRGRVA